MSRWEQVASATVPGEGGELRLLHRRGEYSIRTAVHGELMNSRSHGSEDALGTLACERIARRRSARVLIGGLGMGFTLATALSALPPDATVVVAELLPEVVCWNQHILGACAGHPLRDPRVRVEQADVHSLIRDASAAYDAIALDVDNGPEGLTRPANDRLYSPQGLSNTYRALRPGGTLAVWSAGPDAAFTDRVRRAGFLVDVRRVRAHGSKGARHVIWLAGRP